MGKAKILVVDDELIMRESLAGWLERDGHQVDKAASGEEALKLLENTKYDILLLDIKMEGMSGLEVLKKVRVSDPEVAVVMITAYGSVSTAIEAMKNGAFDYLMKPFDPNELGLLIDKIIDRQERDRENLFLREEYRERTRFESMLGQSRLMQEVFRLIEDIATTDSTVLITGETGTGKGLAAKAIHSKSPRHAGPFVAVNCGAFPEHLLESELFGYEKGAFTDAKTSKKGRLELAHGGTLFLDEIGEISMRMQIDLLRVLEDRVFYRVGGTRPIEADFRVIAATNKDLSQAIRDRTFRQDLFYRLNVISIVMPPLRDRKEDIPILAEHFLRRFRQETNKDIDKISREAMDEMMLYEWPGNVRELENAIERAVVVAKGRTILPEHLPIFAPEHRTVPKGKSLREIEKAHILAVLEETNWNIKKSADTLEIDRSTLYSKIKRYGIHRPD
ncbi:MAG: sigma-54-dependent Fis family transcriptional regulator [Deltaproteobacteria bacterium]|nr:sigma-54-dependent Fis family transcriptional regulator [Deltaproteobacteria bacterium]MBW2082055.1 sigma-54-dependent Fis family transcriptional regulator [Deltaproteobacteria bacterium]HDM10355.1 sigma-54-dependent Fis family transcriptional regulator [Desulfobacteraceae bacterium]